MPGLKRWNGAPAALVYVTAGSRAQALKIGRRAVAERLAACANVLSGMRSIYRWKGRVCKGNEAVLILKTRKSLAGRLISRIKSLHSYECPCVVTLPIENGNPDFLKWIERETRM